ncbi:MAG: hypothetical protein HY763_14945 [Planctomycetes bacterium]|nr:hypothetical protein [Planctomycetota bacterium]
MSRTRSMLDTARRTTRTVYVIAGFYVVIGLSVAVVAALGGDRLSAFLGFLIVSGALGAGLVLQQLIRVSARAAAMADALDDIRRRLDRLAVHTSGSPQTVSGVEATAAPSPSAPEDARELWMDLAALGTGDAGTITAATLDRSVFPRLVTTMDQAEAEEPPRDGLTTRNLLNDWQVAVRQGDIAACRRIVSTLMDTADAATMAPLTAQLQAMTDRAEASLREQFAAQVRRGDYAAALATGDQMAALLPDRPVASEYGTLRPHLLRRAQAAEAPQPPPLAVVR